MDDDSEEESVGLGEVVKPRELAKEYAQSLMRYVTDPPQLESLVQQRREHLAQGTEEGLPGYEEFIASEKAEKIARRERAEARRNARNPWGRGGGDPRARPAASATAGAATEEGVHLGRGSSGPGRVREVRQGLCGKMGLE